MTTQTPGTRYQSYSQSFRTLLRGNLHSDASSRAANLHQLAPANTLSRVECCSFNQPSPNNKRTNNARDVSRRLQFIQPFLDQHAQQLLLKASPTKSASSADTLTSKLPDVSQHKSSPPCPHSGAHVVSSVVWHASRQTNSQVRDRLTETTRQQR